MPLRKISMVFSKNSQTTAYPVFQARRQTDPTFMMNPGDKPNPLIGWRKQIDCSCNNLRWQEVFKNVDGPDCCKPRLRMVQNRAASSAAQTAANGGVPFNVSGKIDRSYNHNYRQYLRKRCKLAYYDIKNSGQFSFSNHIGTKPCCTVECTCDGGNCTSANIKTYKRNNWGFRKQGAVDNDIYITKKLYQGLNTCPCLLLEGDNPPVQRRDPPQYPEDNPKNYNKRANN